MLMAQLDQQRKHSEQQQRELGLAEEAERLRTERVRNLVIRGRQWSEAFFHSRGTHLAIKG